MGFTLEYFRPCQPCQLCQVETAKHLKYLFYKDLQLNQVGKKLAKVGKTCKGEFFTFFGVGRSWQRVLPTLNTENQLFTLKLAELAELATCFA